MPACIAVPGSAVGTGGEDAFLADDRARLELFSGRFFHFISESRSAGAG